MTASLVVLFARGAIVLAVALLAMRLMHRTSAALRHAVLASSLAATLALPAIALAVPTWHTGRSPARRRRLCRSRRRSPNAHRDHAGRGSSCAARATRPSRGARSRGALWLVGLAIGVLRVGVGSLRARRLAARGTPAPDTDAHVRAAWRALDGRDAPPRVVVSAEVEAPIVVGSLAPIVVVPRSSSSWSADRWRIVLLHELAHVAAAMGSRTSSPSSRAACTGPIRSRGSRRGACAQSASSPPTTRSCAAARARRRMRTISSRSRARQVGAHLRRRSRWPSRRASSRASRHSWTNGPRATRSAHVERLPCSPAQPRSPRSRRVSRPMPRRLRPPDRRRR